MRATASVVEPANLSGTRCRSDDAECVAALHRSPEFFCPRCRFARTSRVV